MLRDFPSGELKQLFHLYFAWLHKRKRRLVRARKRLDLAISANSDPPAYILALDASLMVGEDRHRLAQARFDEGARLAIKGDSSDDDFVAKYCQLSLAIYDESVGWEEIKGKAEAKNAAWHNASRMLQVFLPRSRLDKLQEICGHRVPHAKKGSFQYSKPTKINSVVAFDL